MNTSYASVRVARTTKWISKKPSWGTMVCCKCLFGEKTAVKALRKTWDKLQNLPGMKLATDVTLLFLSAIDNDIFVHFYVTSMHYEINWINEHLSF